MYHQTESKIKLILCGCTCTVIMYLQLTIELYVPCNTIVTGFCVSFAWFLWRSLFSEYWMDHEAKLCMYVYVISIDCFFLFPESC